MLVPVLNVSGMMTPESMIQLLTGKPTYVPGEKIQIIGAFSPNDLIHIDLINPFDGTKNSTLLQSDNTGHFRTNYVVPNDAVNGTWKILATSGVNHASLDIQVISSNYGIKNENTTHVSGSGGSTTAAWTKSPLQQFKSGISTNHIICKKDLYVILKAENNVPACVDIETGKNLVQRGWATAFGTSMNDYWSTCNKSFPQSNSSTSVLYMPVNSIGKICLRYSNYNNEPETVTPPRISDPNNSYQKVKDITIWTYTPISTISKDNGTTVAYFIKTGNQTGFYGLSIPSCGEIPFAVGYNNDSNITSRDFPFLGVTISCPPGMLYPQIDGIEGIGIKYIP